MCAVNSGGLTVQRDSHGRFARGNSIGPRTGRKPRDKAVKAAFEEYCVQARDVLVSVMLDVAARPADRIRAAEIILDRGLGKPRQQIEADVSADVRTLDLSTLTDAELLALADE